MAHKVIEKSGLGFFFWTLDLAFLEGCCVLPGYSLSLTLLRKLLTEPVWCFRFWLSIFEANSQLYYFPEKWALKSVDEDAHNKQIIFPLLIVQPDNALSSRVLKWKSDASHLSLHPQTHLKEFRNPRRFKWRPKEGRHSY